MAAGDLTTLAKVKRELKIDPGEVDDNSLLADLITQVSAWFVAATGRGGILSTSYTDKFDGHGGLKHVLTNYPVISLTSVTVDGTAVPVQPAVGESGYVLVDDAAELVGYQFTCGKGNVSIAYVAGYTVVPANIERAIIEQVTWVYKMRDRQGQRSRVVAGGETVQFETAEAPASVMAIVDRYRRIGF